MAASQDAALPAPVLAGALVALAAAAVFIWFGPHLWRQLMTRRSEKGASRQRRAALGATTAGVDRSSAR